MIRVAWVRGAYLNPFEGQNYVFDPKDGIDITGFSSRFPLGGGLRFPVVKLPSIADLYAGRHLEAIGRGVRFIANRVIGDAQNLVGLEKAVSGFDIVHTADPTYYYSYQLARMRKDGDIRCLVATSWETIPRNNESAQAKKRMKYFVHSYIDAYVCHSDKAKRALITEGVTPDKIEVIPLGVDMTRFSVAPQKPSPVFLFAGRLVSEKGVTDVLSAFKIVHKRISGASLLIVGTGPLGTKLKAFVDENDLREAVTFAVSDYENMPEWYRKASIFVAPSALTRTWEEQYGMVFVEALASGLPIITTRSGAIPEVVGRPGVYVPEHAVSELADAMVRLSDNPITTRKIGTMGRERAVKTFDATKTAGRIASLYQCLYRT